MENKDAIVISCYFGKLPATFVAWAYSCSYNIKYNFLLVTDQAVEEKYPNLKIEQMQFEEVQKRIKNRISEDAVIQKPYKICDFKPAYGVIFSEFTNGYPFWGHCDIDMVFGDLSYYFTSDLMEKYDKLQYLGHLSLYRNSHEVNKYCIEFGMRHAFITETNCGFDEDQGIYKDFINKGLKVYSERNFFDIYPYSSHMELDNAINKRNGYVLDTNYHRQMFIWYMGKVFRIFYKTSCNPVWEQGLYIHMGKNQIIEYSWTENCNALLFSKHKIQACRLNTLKEVENLQIINKYNKYSFFAKILDNISFTRFKIERKVRSICKWIKT